MTGPRRRRRHGFTRAKLDELLDTEERLTERLGALTEQVAAIGRGLENLTGRLRTAERRVGELATTLHDYTTRLSTTSRALHSALGDALDEEDALHGLDIGD